MKLLLLTFLSCSLFLSLWPGAHSVVRAQDGSATAGATPPDAISSYTCDNTTCVLPNCRCASTDAPGGLTPAETPMFVVFTADDAVQSYTIDAINGLLGNRTNPNGCSVKMTFFAQIAYSNFSLISEWAVFHEIADHTMTHVEQGGADEIDGNLIALNALAGIPLSAIKGFRAPYLNYTAAMLEHLAATGFLYDSSATASSPVNATNTDAFWPYTLDYGLVNDCLTFDDICYGKPALPGFWEVPMYALFDSSSTDNIHLMDPWLDNPDPAFTLQFMKETFTAHYNGKRQPFGLYTHPIHIATNYPGVAAPTAMIAMINEFLDWVQEQDNVWIVSTEQLLDWVRDPKSIADLNDSDALKCSTPSSPNPNICNGLPGYNKTLLEHCPFSDFPFYTCYGCPVEQPTPANPNPAQSTSLGYALRYRLPSNCSTACWDPVGNVCASGSDCMFEDISRPIGPNGANLTGGGTGTDTNTSAASASTSVSSIVYVPFNAASPLAGTSIWGVTISMLGVSLSGLAICFF